MYHSIYLEHLKYNTYLENTWFYEKLSEQLLPKLHGSNPSQIALIGFPERIQSDWAQVYPQANITMISYQTKQTKPVDPLSWPIEKASMDACVYGPAWCWSESFQQAFSRVKQSLKPEGTMLLSGIGHMTTNDWDLPGVPQWPNVLEVGNALHQLGLEKVAVSNLTMTFTYPTAKALVQDCRDHGLWVVAADPSRKRWYQWASKLKRSNQRIQLEVELIFAHACVPKTPRCYQDASGKVHVSVDSLLAGANQG